MRTNSRKQSKKKVLKKRKDHQFANAEYDHSKHFSTIEWKENGSQDPTKDSVFFPKESHLLQSKKGKETREEKEREREKYPSFIWWWVWPSTRRHLWLSAAGRHKRRRRRRPTNKWLSAAAQRCRRQSMSKKKNKQKKATTNQRWSKRVSNKFFFSWLFTIHYRLIERKRASMLFFSFWRAKKNGEKKIGVCVCNGPRS